MFSVYRYLVLLSLSILGIVSWFMFRDNKKFTRLSYPYFKEEILLLLKTWVDGFGHVWSGLTDRTVSHMEYYILAFIHASLLLNFALFHGDLRYNLYLLPLSLLFWLYIFLEYYFFKFIASSAMCIRELVVVKIISELPKQKDYYTDRQ